MSYCLVEAGNLLFKGTMVGEKSVFVMEAKDKSTYQVQKDLISTIVHLKEDFKAIDLGPFENLNPGIYELKILSDNEHEFFNRNELEEKYPGFEYSYLCQDKKGQYLIGTHQGPCELYPAFYLENPADISGWLSKREEM